jgi:hypothetical protein
MSWWQWLLAFFGLMWLITEVTRAASKAEDAARDASMLRYELETLKGYIERSTELLVQRQATGLRRLRKIEDRMFGTEPEDDAEDDDI